MVLVKGEDGVTSKSERSWRNLEENLIRSRHRVESGAMVHAQAPTKIIRDGDLGFVLRYRDFSRVSAIIIRTVAVIHGECTGDRRTRRERHNFRVRWHRLRLLK